MKSSLKQLWSARTFIDNRYILDADRNLVESNTNKPLLCIGQACALSRDLFWATSKNYPRSAVNELVNILKAEKATLPPMEGAFLWRFSQWTSKEFTIDYFVVPTQTLELIPQDVKFLIPHYPSEQGATALLDLTHSDTQEQIAAAFSEYKLHDVIGLTYDAAGEKGKAAQRLSTKSLIISCAAAIALTLASVTGYLQWSLQSLEQQQVANQVKIDEVLSKRNDFERKVTSYSELGEFLKKSPNVLAKLSHLNLEGEDVILERVVVSTNGVQVSGSTKSSATNLLQQVIASEQVKEAKFSRPVVKQNSGVESFTIEVYWL